MRIFTTLLFLAIVVTTAFCYADNGFESSATVFLLILIPFSLLTVLMSFTNAFTVGSDTNAVQESKQD
jgi:hypothetical protein